MTDLTIKLRKDLIVDRLLLPVSKIVDNCSVVVTKSYMYTLCNTEDGTIVLYCNVACDNNSVTEKIVLNINNIKRFIRVIDCIPQNEISFTVDSNSINYASDSLKFKFHMVEDDVIKKSLVSIDKIDALKFDGTFTMTGDKIKELTRAATFVDTVNKVYLSAVGTNVKASVTDRSTPNMDAIGLNISSDYNGPPISDTPFGLDVFNKMSIGDVKVKVNVKQKFALLEQADNEFTVKYIISALVK